MTVTGHEKLHGTSEDLECSKVVINGSVDIDAHNSI